ncbi:hypothetical protein MMC16_004728 [Acarospora aff. strigata]|nr:hypothetical protein [Acarospora aff. strigata]
MPPPTTHPPPWRINTYLILSLLTLRLFTRLRSHSIAHILNENFRVRSPALQAQDVRYIVATVTAMCPPWFEHMATMRDDDPRVVGVIGMLSNAELRGHVPVDVEPGEGEEEEGEGEGAVGARRRVEVLVGRRAGRW